MQTFRNASRKGMHDIDLTAIAYF